MTDPFRYAPHPLVLNAARETAEFISRFPELEHEFRKGKMIGVLIYRDQCSSETGYIAAFSGNVGGMNNIKGFVPPIYDLLVPSGTFKKGESELSAINSMIVSLEQSPVHMELRERLQKSENERDIEITEIRTRMAVAKMERDSIRMKTDDSSRLEELIRQSQYEKADFKRKKEEWNRRITSVRSELDGYVRKIKDLKAQRAELSDRLQKWIFGEFIVHNSLGEIKSIAQIFMEEDLVPPGGTGECAAPKLLEYAYRNSLKPVAMGEFWYGADSQTSVRLHGHFYPSCTSKCGPLLKFMMLGLEIDKEDRSTPAPQIIHIDNSIIVVSKPPGMPSVPGLDGKVSLEEELSQYGAIPVHRLDMDTSGIMIFARNEISANHLRRQFEEHTIKKEYIARLVPTAAGTPDLKTGMTGDIRLPMSPDYDERPRQKVDHVQGKEALTTYRVISANDDGSTDIEFFPHTGRTHQLRVHSAHSEGLARPIAGDMLYGGCGSLDHDIKSSRLCLHASRITFTHPDTNKDSSFETSIFKF